MPRRALYALPWLALATTMLMAAPLGAQFPGLGSTSTARDSARPNVSNASPRAAVQEFLRRAESENWEQAAEYLALSAKQRERAPQLARRFKSVIDQRLSINVESLSPAAVGDTTDGDFSGDTIGLIRNADGGEDPVRLERLTESGLSRWVFSQRTTARIDEWYDNLGMPWLRDRLPNALQREGPFNVFYWQWIGLGVTIPMLVLIAWLVGSVLRFLLTRVAERTDTDWDDLLLENLRGPFRLWLAALAAAVLLPMFELNARVSSFVTALTRGLVLIALFWSLLRVIRLVQRRLENAAWATGQGAQARTLVPLLGNFLRVTLAIVALLVALAQFGYPVGTLLAGLGIGGIAIALAAQKTVEHLFGSVSLAADNAFRVGDWVRAGETQGSVERIGLRSTSFRTLDRTVVRIPNGRLADERIETFGERDRILLKTDVDVTYDTTPEQLVSIRDGLEAVLRARPEIWPDVVRVHIVDFTDSAIRLHIDAWFRTLDYAVFLQIRHELYLEFMKVVREHGSSFAFPSRTVYHVQAEPPTMGASGASGTSDFSGTVTQDAE